MPNDDNDKTNKKNKVKSAIEAVTGSIEYVYSVLFRIIRPPISQVIQILDEGSIAKRAAVWAGIILTIYCVHWCFGLVMNPPEVYTGMDIAAIIGAILAPMAGLTGALMKYGESITIKKDDSKDG